MSCHFFNFCATQQESSTMKYQTRQFTVTAVATRRVRAIGVGLALLACHLLTGLVQAATAG